MPTGCWRGVLKVVLLVVPLIRAGQTNKTVPARGEVEAMAQINDLSHITTDGTSTFLANNHQVLERGMPTGTHARALGTVEQRSALEALYSTTKGAESWTTKWDLTAADHCGWAGVTCDDESEVTKLRLNAYGLKGTLPSLEVLTSLTRL